LTLDRVVISGNYGFYAGGIYNAGNGINGGTLTVKNSTIISNNSSQEGGGIYNSGLLNISGTTIAFNTSNVGGGIENFATMVIINSTFFRNSANSNGGAFYNAFNESYYAVNIYNSTIVANGSDQDRDGDGAGGGIYLSNGSGGTFNIYNTLLAGNYYADSPQPDDCAGPATLSTHARDLFGTTDGCTISQVSGSFKTLAGSLSDLQDNGGPTYTIALLAGSNAIDDGDLGCFDQFSNPILTDQRGFKRPLGACDVGAFEFDPDRIFLNGFN
jgi:hypothetical protein